MTRDVIAALATAAGESALGVVRLSGPGCRDVAQRFLRLRAAPPRSACLAVAHGEDGDLDRVLVTFFPGPDSYTGEDLLEISAHGSPYILDSLLRLAHRHGARPAFPGEFTLRAFLNGRMDLAQAEAVGALIRARTRSAHRSALEQLQGGLSRRLEELRRELLAALAHVEAAIDHPDEDIPALSAEALGGRIASLRARIAPLLSSYRRGRLAREGARVAIVGRPNVGKSSLLNALLGRERAIVAERAGTTRDTIEEAADLHGCRAVLIDTAGLREQAEDPAEREGMRRTRQALEAADVALLVLDGSVSSTAEDERLAGELRTERQRPAVLAVNKADLPDALGPSGLERLWPSGAAIRVSALAGEGIEALARAIADAAVGGQAEEGASIASLRHRKALEDADAGLARAAQALGSPELAAVGLRECLHAVGLILGETAGEDVLGEIFSTFCVGK